MVYNPLQKLASDRQLSQIVDAINNRFGTEFTEADRLLFDQVGLDLINDEAIIKQAKTNSFEGFLQGSLRDKSMEKFIDRMDINNSTTSNILNNEKLADAVIFKYLAKFIYEKYMQLKNLKLLRKRL